MKRTAERIDFLANVLVSAVEGGSNYWATMRKYRWAQDAQHRLTAASIEIKDAEDEHSSWRAVGLNTIARGIKCLQKGKVALGSDYKKDILLADAENDASHIDSADADCILQAGLFGEIIYG